MENSSRSKIAIARKRTLMAVSGIGLLMVALMVVVLLPVIGESNEKRAMEATSNRLEIVHELQIRVEAIVKSAKILEVGGLTSKEDVYIKEINEELPIIYSLSREYSESGPQPDKRISEKVLSVRLTKLLFLVEGIVELYPNEEVSSEDVVLALEKKHKLLKEQLDTMGRIEMDRLQEQAKPDNDVASKTLVIGIACVAMVFVLTVILVVMKPIVFFREESLIAAAQEVGNR